MDKIICYKERDDSNEIREKLRLGSFDVVFEKKRKKEKEENEQKFQRYCLVDVLVQICIG